ncbi:MAG: DUF4974 domain-containing protein [Bacteroidetes bacterium]|nr:MAG: DUF4974 domain-containing protein [Bacteroidota bacterium]
MDKKDNLPEDILRLLIGRETGNLDSKEQACLDAWQNNNPQFKEETGEYIRLIHQTKALGRARKVDKEKAWHTISRRVNEKSRQSFDRRIFLKVAAIMLPLIIASAWLYFSQSSMDTLTEQPKDALASVRQSRATLVLSGGKSIELDGMSSAAEMQMDGVTITRDKKDQIRYGDAEAISTHSLLVPRGSEFQLVLPDGSKVFLNSGSRLDYPTGFDSDQRRVYLSGEAHFEVVTDPNRPFIVSTPSMEITVKGTSFNIMDYEGERAEATLVQGIILVDAGAQPAVVLSPGQQARWDTPAGKLEIRQVNVNDFTSWIRGVFTFRDMKLEELALRLERWYDVEISFADPAIADMRFTGAMEKDKPLENLLALIMKSANIDFEQKDEQIILRTK